MGMRKSSHKDENIFSLLENGYYLFIKCPITFKSFLFKGKDGFI